MPTGRPTKYKEEMIDLVDKYLEENQDEEYDYIKSESGSSMTKEQKLIVRLPTIEGFASFLGVATSSVHLWATEYPRFSEALEKIKEEQRKRLLNKGLNGQYNSTIAKLILSANHGMNEKKEMDVTTNGKDITSMSNEELAKLIK